MEPCPHEISPIEDRLEKDAYNRGVFASQFSEEQSDLHFLATEFARFGGHLTPIDLPEFALAGDLYRMASDALGSASLFVMSAKGLDALTFVRKAVEAIAYASYVTREPEMARLYVERKKRVQAFRLRFRRSRLFPKGSEIRERLFDLYNISSDVGTHANLEGFIGRRSSEIRGDSTSVAYESYDLDPKMLNRYLLVVLRTFCMVYSSLVDVFSQYIADSEEVSRIDGVIIARYSAACRRFFQRWPDEIPPSQAT